METAPDPASFSGTRPMRRRLPPDFRSYRTLAASSRANRKIPARSADASDSGGSFRTIQRTGQCDASPLPNST